MLRFSAMPSAAASDADLVQQSLGGNRDAFGLIVTRYQSLICSLAYSATDTYLRALAVGPQLHWMRRCLADYCKASIGHGLGTSGDIVEARE